jgi:hypothetical protein
MQESVTTYCETHPDIESELRCGRCERLICPRCLVYTPGGVRCRDCAQLRRPVMYELGTEHYLRGTLASIVVGVAIGLVGGLLLPPNSRIAFFGLLLGVFAGMGAGSLIAEAITRATRGKRGLSVQWMAINGLLIAGVVRLVVSGELDEITRDLFGLVTIGVAMAVAWGRLR